jgi:hypothetical protein
MEIFSLVHLYSMKVIFLFLSLCFSSTLLGQDSVVVCIQLNDKQDGVGIQNVNVQMEIDTMKMELSSNRIGKVYFNATVGQSFSFNATHFKFNEITAKRKVPTKNIQDTITYQFEMEFIRVQNQDEMVVAAPGVPTVYFKSNQLSVADFEVLKSGEMLLLTYPKRLNKGNELLVYDGRNIKRRFSVPDVAEELVLDYRKNPHVVCDKNVYGVILNNNDISLSTIDKAYFMKYLAPILDTNKTKLYFSNFNKDYPAFDYFTYDQIDSSYTKILEIKDDLMMELYRSEYKWVDVRTKLWAKNLELQTGIDAEIYVGANYFTQSPYYKELYAPLFHRNDSLFVFDYYKDKLRTYNDLGEPLDSVSIYHHYDKRKTGWESELIQDSQTGEIYALFDRAGFSYLGRIDTKTGEITEQVKLEYRFVEKIAIHNNFVYYIYRPFESPQKKYLYMERLPYSFGSANLIESTVQD